VLRELWGRHGDRMRHWLAVVITIVVVLTYMGWRDTADWTVFVLAVVLLLVLEFLLQGEWLRRRDGRGRRPDDPRD
jgi:4-amino-4-deoxy-L-arabinose transferase-like glycosyltransferase